MRYFLFFAMMSIAVICSSAGGEAARSVGFNDAGSSVHVQADSLSALDYASELGALQRVDLLAEDRTNNDAFLAERDVLLQYLHPAIKSVTLTPRESARLSSVVLGGPRLAGISQTMVELAQFVAHEGYVPADAAEQLAKPWSQSTLNEFLALSRAEQLSILIDQIDPLTGKLYSDYTDPDWREFGVFAELVPAEEWGKYFEHPETLSTTVVDSNGPTGKSQPATHVLRFVLFGETPGRILIDAPLWWTASD